ncbi:transposase [Caryophanon latum]|uniref:Transposase n=1 Tax=Caryophanon latum TaxID=33977 RepID=A0A1C0YIT6_9BACL|nr:transposase [Caryophanon latum]
MHHEVNQHIGISRGGRTTKIHAIVDALGNPLLFQLTSGQVHDSQPACALFDQLAIEGRHVLGDKAYGAQAIRNQLTSQGASYTIPPRTNAKKHWSVDWNRYKERHVIECFFNKIKHFRRVATRYDKLATSFLTFVYIAAIFKLTQ